ncbi:uncharacterized protein FOBCDRAFT_233793 [Fusarium oxysporum Fo47]|uniref:Uncharacterized protein n=1 Tax=Fusarium oxysporum Fo47 TaxID=660027 RepID=W9JMF6_FUSOX|nr:uncharacterized protein FOBCDRAFT_233793 [Fusarium oxysporum Fo47]EWZ30578.1 hypothetical protein FOZG_16051 [Fusarium oxysporum Fo47]QKD61994.1 hypothetical protein FOBCDRAFT_233793 [Fusarium oxysporum Fo47]
MSSLTKVVNGKVVTNTNVKPPTGWTVNYEDFGSETEWGEDGEVADLVSAYGISGQVKPLFRTRYSSNEVIFVIEINEQDYIYNGESGWVQRIVTPTDLNEIVEFINEQGWFRLETENLG